MASSKLLEAVAVTAELCGRTFSEAAARVFVSDLSGYDEAQVIAALGRCRREVRGMLTVADVITRLDDGRPTADEAWAMLPVSESESVVWTEEMALAFGISSQAGDKQAARMAFRSAYQRFVEQARTQRKPTNWTASLGHDPRGRQAALEQAVKLGRLPYAHAKDLMPTLHLPIHEDVLELLEGAKTA